MLHDKTERVPKLSKARAGVTAVMHLAGNVDGLSARMYGSDQVDFHEV